jgi:SAM-dependent methyltransferase
MGKNRTMGVLMRSKLHMYIHCLIVAISLIVLLPNNVQLRVEALSNTGIPKSPSSSTSSSSTGSISKLIVKVAHLDWTISPEELSKQILQVVVPTSTTAEAATATNNNNDSNIVVQFTQLSNPPRKRDENKLHGGSATLTFQSTREAAMAMERIESFSKQQQQLQQQQEPQQEPPRSWGWKAKWAWEPPTINQEEEVPSAEVIARRKMRAEAYVRRKQRVAQRTDEIIQSVLRGTDDADGGNTVSLLSVLQAPRLDWSSCPNAIDPVRGGGIVKGTARGQRKQAAVEAFLHVLENILLLDEEEDDVEEDEEGIKKRHDVIADLGCGGGNLSLSLAWWLHKKKPGRSSVLAVDINGRSLDILGQRAKEADAAAASSSGGTTTGFSSCIETMEQDLLRLIRPPQDDDNSSSSTAKNSMLLPADCSAVVSLHACGSASDMAMAVATSHSLPFAISPCCIGKVNTIRQPQQQHLVSGRMMPQLLSTINRSAAPSDFSYPRSAWLSNALKDSLGDYHLLTSAADYSGVDSKDDDEEEMARRLRCRKAKRIVEADRLRWAKEWGYYVRMVELPRIGPHYPKRELLLGAKKGTKAAFRISQLVTI